MKIKMKIRTKIKKIIITAKIVIKIQENKNRTK